MSDTNPPQAGAAPTAAPRWRKRMTDFLMLAAFVGFYFLLQLVILPRLGFST